VIPIRDANPTQRRPWLTLALIALNVVAFVVWQGFPITGDLTRAQARVVICHGAVPFEVSHFQPLPELVQLCGGKSVALSVFTSMFLHANLVHIGGNMLFLWVFGNNVEDRMGRAVFMLFYLAAGVAAAVAQVLISPDSRVPLIGASGAIAGTLGAYLVLFPRARVLTAVIFFFITLVEVPAVVVLGLWFVLQFFSGIGQLGESVSGGVAFFAHIGGFAFGALIALLFYRSRRQEPYQRPGLDY
jgi:membrane associated rhomboid family serine protease